MTDIPGNSSTTTTISVGDSLTGTIDTGGDHDWIAVHLVAGQKYEITLDGYGSNPLEDPYLYLHNAAGTVVAENDDGNGDRNSRLVFTATTSGTYYIDAAAWDDDTGTYKYTGGYKLSVELYTPPPVFDYDQIADQLVNGYWGGDFHHFDVTQGGTITVNITALTAAGQTFARAALQEWTDIIGMNFKEVVTGGQITFDDSDDGAYTTADWSNHITTSAAVNISTDWIADYGTSLNTYSFQTYLHEIGHALGLGHAGNYNETATYPDDAVFYNDAWSTTIMSYFSPREASYFAERQFSYDFALTPMNGDIVAMQTLYGLSTSTRTGNTTYGYGSNAGPVYNTTQNPDAAYTIFDSGGTDTMNYGATSSNEWIDLNSEAFSSVAGSTGNVSIAIGTVIENATSGSGDDVIVGNSADNVLNGGSGTDDVWYTAATAGVTVDMRISGLQNTVGAGRDTLIGIEQLTGSNFADRLIAASTTSLIHAGGGNDVIVAAAGSGCNYYGDTGDDTLIPTSVNDIFDGGDGYDTIDFSHFTAGVTSGVGITGNLNWVERVIGTAFSDTLTGAYAGTEVDGGGGNDIMKGLGNSAGLAGGVGNDTYYVQWYDEIVERPGEGTDRVIATSSFTLSANVEQLTLATTLAIDGTGNALANVLTGNDAANVLIGLGGNDLLYGNGGNDTLDGGSGADKLLGGIGNDTYVVDNAGDAAYETAGEGTDTVIASVSAALRANIEDLTLTGTAGIYGKGNELANEIDGNSGANRLSGLAGNDTLVGGGGRDILDGGAGNDMLKGGGDNDIYVIDSSSDVIVENAGEGVDFVQTSASYTLSANVDRMYLLGSGNIDGTGNGLANLLVGNGGSNSLSGMGANDRMYGAAGADMLDGGDGNDYMEGGTGQDDFIGGAGKDYFVFRDGDFGGSTAAIADRIEDFALGDRISLSPVDANVAASGNQAFAFIGTAAFDGAAGELRYEQSGGNTYLSADTNGDGTADFMIKLDGLHALTTSDLLL